MLELAILGLLIESPMHGYELRKRLTGLLGALRAFSYGSLYPALRRMQEGAAESTFGCMGGLLHFNDPVGRAVRGTAAYSAAACGGYGRWPRAR